MQPSSGCWGVSGFRFWPRGLQEFLAGLWGASSSSSCSSASSSCQIREACDVETCVSTRRTQWATPLAPCPASPPPHAAPSRSHPPPPLFRGSGGRLGVDSCQAGSSWGCGQGSGQLDPDAVALVGPGGEQAGSSQSQLSFCDPNRIFETTANPGAAGAGGVVTTQPVTDLLRWVGMLQQAIVAQLPGGLCAGRQSQPGPLLCRGSHRAAKQGAALWRSPSA